MSRIHVFSNLAVSVDGKIAPVDRGFFPLGTPEDRLQMQRLRRESDAILYGASTLRAYRKFCATRDLPPGRSEPMNIVVSSNLDRISAEWPFFTRSRSRRVLIVGPETTAARIRRFSRSSEIFVLKKATAKRPHATQILEIAEGLGVRRLLVEGGGEVMALFTEHNLIDEYHVTVTPRILGGRAAPTLVDGKGLSGRDSLTLRLTQCRLVGEELYLVYRKS